MLEFKENHIKEIIPILNTLELRSVRILSENDYNRSNIWRIEISEESPDFDYNLISNRTTDYKENRFKLLDSDKFELGNFNRILIKKVVYNGNVYPFYKIDFIEKYRHTGIKFTMNEESFIRLNREINLLKIS